MIDYNKCSDKYVLKMFTMSFPNYKDDIVDYYYIGDTETIFHISDGSKVIFDGRNKTAKHIGPRPNARTELSEEEWLSEFSRKLKRKLSMSNITRKELSLKTGISIGTIYRYVRGERVPDIFSIKKIARALNRETVELTDFDYLL